MKKFYLLVLAICLVVQGYSQSDFVTDHKHHIKILGSAKDSLYQIILGQYGSYIQANPKDLSTQVQRCRFIQNSYYDSYEDYNPKEAEAETCVQQLIERFPGQPEALLFGTEFIYGDSLQAYLKYLEIQIQQDPTLWRDNDWAVYEKLADYYREEDDEMVIQYAELAIQANDTLDLSILMANAFKNRMQNEKAIQVLLNKFDSTDKAWTLNQKGKLFLDLGAPDQAIRAFKIASTDTSAYHDEGALAQAMIDNGLGAEARPYLLKQYLDESWHRSNSLQKLLTYDLAFSSRDSAAVTYNRFVKEDFWNDPFGIYRLKLLVQSPTAAWSFDDLARILLLVLLLGLVFVIPYLWILPIHYYGTLQRSRGVLFAVSGYRWGLTHFWVACSLWLVCDILAVLIFDYPAIISIFNDQVEPQTEAAISQVQANLSLFFWIGCLAFTMGFLPWDAIKTFVLNLANQGGRIGTGIGFAFVLKLATGFYVLILNRFGITTESFLSVPGSINDSIISVNTFYSPWLGFLLVVVLVPLYEEILFRGIFLSACQRNMRFVLANALQSLVFALIHQRLILIPFYFAFGFIAGAYRQKSGSMVSGVSMHMTNNLMAFLAIVARS